MLSEIVISKDEFSNIRSNWLASPLVIAFAIAERRALICRRTNWRKRVWTSQYLKDIQSRGIQTIEATLTRETFEKQYKNILEGNSQWQKFQ